MTGLALSVAAGLCAAPGCFDPDGPPADGETDTSGTTADGPLTGTGPMPTTGGPGTATTATTATTAMTTNADTTVAGESTTMDADSSTTDAPPAVCGDGVLSAGNVCFDDIREFTLQEFAVSLELVDINGDDNLDIGGVIPDDVQYLLGAGDGSFGVRVSGGTIESTTADFARVDPDGFADIVFLSSQGSNLVVATGDGMSFAPAGGAPLPNGGRQVQVTRFNDDDRPDALAVSNQGLHFFANDPAGGLAPMGQESASGITDFALADINGDTRDDAIYVTNGTLPRVRAMFGGAPGGFSTSADLIDLFDFGLSGPNTNQIATGQLNDDDNADIALGHGAAILVAFGNGVAGFTDQVELACLSQPTAIETGDIDGDGVEDVIAGYGDSTSVSLFRARGDGTFEARVDFGVSTATSLLSTGDVNGDGVDDVLTADGGSSSIVTLLISTP